MRNILWVADKENVEFAMWLVRIYFGDDTLKFEEAPR